MHVLAADGILASSGHLSLALKARVGPQESRTLGTKAYLTIP
jgi:hypothetical protein